VLVAGSGVCDVCQGCVLLYALCAGTLHVLRQQTGDQSRDHLWNNVLLAKWCQLFSRVRSCTVIYTQCCAQAYNRRPLFAGLCGGLLNIAEEGPEE
jgi:hypothetical protein